MGKAPASAVQDATASASDHSSVPAASRCHGRGSAGRLSRTPTSTAAAAASPTATYVERVRAARSDRELVEAFLEHVRAGEGASEREAELLAEILDERVLQESHA